MVKPIKIVFDENFYSKVGEHTYNEVMEMEQEITDAIMKSIDSGDITHEDTEDGNIVIGSPTIIYDGDGDLEEVITKLKDGNDEDDLFEDYELINGTVH